MFCPSCGENLPDGSNFCGSCGAKLSEQAEENLTAGSAAESTELVRTVQPAGGELAESQIVQIKTNRKKAAVIAIAAAAVLVLIAAAALAAVLSFSGGGSGCAYLSNGKYGLITKLKKGETLEFASSRSDTVRESMLAFSPDGKYVYYYTKYDDASNTGSLCRAEYGRLREDSSKNNKLIEIIDSNVRLGFRFLNNSALLYKKGDDTLYYYDGTESERVAKSVSSYFTDGSSGLAYTTGSYIDGFTLYGVRLSDLDDKIKLASNCSSVHTTTDMENIFYEKSDSDGGSTLYVTGLSREPEKLGSGAEIVSAADAVYYTVNSGEKLSLYDYVTDAKAAADAGLTEPALEDYSTPTYSYYPLDSTVNPASYTQLYTSCTKGVRFYQTWYSYRSLDYAAQYDMNHPADYQAFVNKYKSLENAEGYIEVTDAVKADLMSLAETCGVGYDGEWLELCFAKQQSGTTYDYDAFNQAKAVYQAAADRIQLRTALKDRANSYPVKTLCRYQNGKTSVISENVLSTAIYDGAILYNTLDMITGTMPLEDISSAYDVRRLFYLDYGAENFLLPLTGTAPVRISASGADDIGAANDSSYAILYVTDSKLYLKSGDGSLSMADIGSGTTGAFQPVVDDVSVLDTDGETLYYVSDMHESNGALYCDLWSCTKGETKRLARDILSDQIKVYSDGSLMVCTDYRSQQGYEAAVIDASGTRTIIGDGISQSIRTDKSNVLFISDGDLYLFDGQDKSRLKRNVDWLWVQNPMEIVLNMSYIDY